MQRMWKWVLAGMAVLLVLGGGVFLALSVFSQPKEPAKISVQKLSSEEAEKAKLHGVAVSGFAGKAGQLSLKNLPRTERGWPVYLTARGKTVDMQELLETTPSLFAELVKTKVPISDATVVIHTDALRDNLGRTLPNLTVAKIRFGADKLKQVDWEHIVPANLPKVADEFWVHPRLQQQQVVTQSKVSQEKKQG